jgi:hypothetical protein
LLAWPPVTEEGAKNEETRVTNFVCMHNLLMDVLSKTMKRSIKKTARRKDVKGK